MFLGGDFVGGEVTGYLRIVECGGKSESGKNKGEEREREENAFLRSHSLPTPRCFSSSRLFAPSYNLNTWNRLALLQCNMLSIVFIAGQSLDEHNTAFQQSFVSALSHWEFRR